MAMGFPRLAALSSTVLASSSEVKLTAFAAVPFFDLRRNLISLPENL
jgi:hypothetical protein